MYVSSQETFILKVCLVLIPFASGVRERLDLTEWDNELIAEDRATSDVDIAGAWIHKRGTFKNNRHYDIIRQGSQAFEGFPITNCYEGSTSRLGNFRSLKRCDSTVSLRVYPMFETPGQYTIKKTKLYRYDSRTLKVSGCGTSRANGEYHVVGQHNNRPQYVKIADESVVIHWSDKRKVWRLLIDETWTGTGRPTLYQSEVNSYLVPEGNDAKWEVNDGSGPPPTVQAVFSLGPTAASKYTVWGGGDKRADGTFTITGTHNKRPEYKSGSGSTQIIIHWSTKRKAWRMFLNNCYFCRHRTTLYVSKEDSNTLPTTGWVNIEGALPVPKIHGFARSTKDATLFTQETSAIVTSEDPHELLWSDGKIWERYAGPQSNFDVYDRQCREMNNGANEKVAAITYSAGFAIAAGLKWDNIPGIKAEFIQCLANSWLAVHQAHFNCILDKATGNSSQEVVANLLGKVRSLLPAAGSRCVPNICFGLGFPIFPIPSPVPSVFAVTTWPVATSRCNGMSLQDEVDRASLEAPIVPTKKSGAHLRHGLVFNLFPLPSVSYIFQGVVPVGIPKLLFRVKHARPNFASVEDKKQAVMREATTAVQASLDECPDIRRRFELHKEVLKRWKRYSEPRTPEEELRLIVSRFPELSGKGTTRVKVSGSWAVGCKAAIGTAGVGVGVFGGPALQGWSLWDSYKGCPSWRRVIKLWKENPVLDVNMEDEHVLDVGLNGTDLDVNGTDLDAVNTLH